MKGDEMGGAYITNGQDKNGDTILIGIHELKGSFGRPRRRWKDSVKRILKK
jgi:hypothetical protein